MKINIPLVSIVIPVYNRESFILETVNSALSQDYSNFEVVVVDNNSTDRTFEILQTIHDEKLKVYRNDQNYGPVKNWLKGIEYAEGVYIKILWSDDLLEKSCIAKLIDGFDETTAFSYSSTRIFNESSSKVRYRLDNSKRIKTNDYLAHLLHSTSDLPVSPGCALFRKLDLMENLEVQIPNNLLIDYSKLAIGNDLLLFLRPLLKYSNVNYILDPVCSFREHDDSISNKSGSHLLDFHYNYIKLYFLEKYYGRRLMYYSYFVAYVYKYILKKNNIPYREYKLCKVLPQFRLVDVLMIFLGFIHAIYFKISKKGTL